MIDGNILSIVENINTVLSFLTLKVNLLISKLFENTPPRPGHFLCPGGILLNGLSQWWCRYFCIVELVNEAMRKDWAIGIDWNHKK
jgi:hypothetical protein